MSETHRELEERLSELGYSSVEEALKDDDLTYFLRTTD